MKRDNVEQFRLWMSPVAFILLGVCILFGASLTWADGNPAPEFIGYTLDGDEVTKESLEGTPTLVMFWAPWCGVCKSELPKLTEYYESEKPDWLEVISIGGMDSEESVRQFVGDRSEVFVFPTVYDEDRNIAREFRIKAVPTYVLLNEAGKIVLFHRGSGFLSTAPFQNFLSN